MNVTKFTILLVSALFLTLPWAQGGTVTFTVDDSLGPVITTDPLGLAGSAFDLSGTVTQGPSGQTLYNVNTLSVTATISGITETLQACDTPGAPSCGSGAIAPTLTISSNSAMLSFDVSVLGILATLDSTINLPAGTLTDTSGKVSLANFTNLTVQPGSTLSYSATILGTKETGEVGVSGTATMSGYVAPMTGVPEPGTIMLLAGGLIGLLLKKRVRA